MLHNEIKQYLEELDKEKKPLSSYTGEHDIANKIKEILAKNTRYKPTNEDIAEQMTFDFMAGYPNGNSGWGTYYGPMFILPNPQDQMIEYPSIKKVTKDILAYWTKRAKETNNPLLSARYADLVIDFFPKITNRNADVDLFTIVIDSNVVICEKSLADPLDCKTKIKRALALAIRINDKNKIEKAKMTIINLEDKVAEDNKPGLWGFAFKWLVLDYDKKIQLSDEERIALIRG